MDYHLIDTIAKIVGRQVDNLSKQAVRVLKIAAKPFVLLNQFVRDQVKTVLRSPESKKDYVRLFGLYFSKRLLAMTVVGAMTAGSLFSLYVYPWMEGRLWTPKILFGSAKLAAYSGPAKIVNDVGTIIYHGGVESGRLTGSAAQYDAGGALVYQGEFQDGKYGGQGTYYEKGVLRYRGGFLENLFEGEGSLYDESGALVYQGDFSQGQPNGTGTAYRADLHTRSYYGTFVGGVPEGTGAAYEADGETVCYRGNFAGGLYEGEGKAYENGILRYSGRFLQGLYDGEGTLYGENGRPVYTGAFLKGVRQGDGTVYDALGSALYTGLFRDGSVDYTGYLGAAPGDLTAAFGVPGYEAEQDGVQIFSYPSLGVSFLCTPNTDGAQICSRVVADVSGGFLTLSPSSGQEELEALFGPYFSRLSVRLTSAQATAFGHLSLTAGERMTAEKYLAESYYIKAYYNRDESGLAAIECGIY